MMPVPIRRERTQHRTIIEVLRARFEKPKATDIE
jgi:hypothetical protein